MKISPKVDELVRKTIGKGRAVEAFVRTCLSKKYARYAQFGIDDGSICHVNLDAMTAHIVTKGACVKSWRKRQAAALGREQAATKAKVSK